MKLHVSLHEKTRLLAGLRQYGNLIALRNRLKREVPRDRLAAFYDAWVFGHLLTKRRQVESASDKLFPLTMKISPTMRCNLNCLGCFAAGFPLSDDLSRETMERVLTQARSLGIRSIGVIGGEPLLCPWIFDVFDRFRDLGFYLVTNGTQMQDDAVAALAELPHVVTVFSIEGFRTTTDSLRGAGVFDRIMDSMERMKDARLIFGFSTVVHRENEAEVVSASYLDYMIRRGCYLGAFLPYIPVGTSPRYGVVCTPAEVTSYYQRLDRVSANRPILILKEGYGDGTFMNQGCGAAQTIHVTNKGDAEPCNGIQFVTANLAEQTALEVLQSPFFQDLRALLPRYGKRCLVINAPLELLELVDRHKARPTHALAREHLEHWATLSQGD